ncbi:MAG: beta-ketoacyl-ACP synthase II [Chloroflexi bacterium]|nr:beta-ketoacyl-ACP synthase II [Chloroflexota bacterium]
MKGNQHRRVVITGLGTINPLGNDVASTWQKTAAGQSGIGRITYFDPSSYKTQIGGEVRDFDPEALFGRKDARRMDRVAQYGLAAAEQALRDAQFDTLSESQKRPIGVIIGNGMGGILSTLEAAQTMFGQGHGRISPFFVPMMLPDSIPARISMHHGLRGPNMSIATACASSTNAIGEAARMVAAGVADVMVTGGAETAIVPISIAGFNVMGAMSVANDDPERACRPFDSERSGFIPSDGAAILVLEELEHALGRGVHIYGEVVGYGSSADAYHLTAPREDGLGAVQAMQMALDESGLAPEQISYINAHGTSTQLNDKSETLAIKHVFGEYAYKLPVSSTKSMHGHLLGAAGALEIVISLQAMAHSFVPPTINYNKPDPVCDLDYVPNVGRSAVINAFMSNSFGFGGHNASLVVKKVA